MQVLDKIYVRSHSSHGGDALDVGALAEACLFYGKTELVLSRGTLGYLLDLYGTDDVLRFVQGEYVKGHFLGANVAIQTEAEGTSDERIRPITFALAGSSDRKSVV